MDPAKVQAVTDWPIPQDLHHVRQFLGFVEFYRRFIEGLSGIASPLTELIKRHTLSLVPCLPSSIPVTPGQPHLSPHSPVTFPRSLITPFMLEQMHLTLPLGVNSARIKAMAESSLHMKAGKLNAAERNYSAYDKEALAVVNAAITWRCYLEAGKSFFSLTMLPSCSCSGKGKSSLQAGQVDVNSSSLSTLEIQHIAGKSNAADPLSRRPDHLQLATLSSLATSTAQAFAAAYQEDPLFSPTQLQSRPAIIFRDPYFVDATTDRIQLPDSSQLRQSLLLQAHDSVLTGHFGHEKDSRAAAEDLSLAWTGQRCGHLHQIL